MSQTVHTARQADDADESGLGRPLPVKHSKIVPYPGQPRRVFDIEDVRELADDILDNAKRNPGTNGQKTPVRVRRHPNRPGVFELIGGERRWRAFGLIGERTGTDPIMNCFIDVVRDDDHHFEEALLDNLRRKDLVPVDEAAGYRRLYDRSDAISHNAKVGEIAKKVGKSTTHIDNYLALDTLSDAVKALMDPTKRKREECLAVSAAVDIARGTKDPDLQHTIAMESIERNLGLAEIRMLVSVRTGKSGYGVSGRTRKPSDDYKAFRAFIAGTLSRANRLSRGLDLNALYSTRDDERGDRSRDAHAVRQAIALLTDMAQQIEREKQ